ncbi:DivIVA domain-containing protein [Streptomyces marispadix]|uniref:DivIVA domain-containing protein n=1 Tax=Streptomyces marispadix TaxID=2922868 RepID=A0ABS9T1K6_9ACTN|nr:DivIVA domain-containing protein [Streptomyces marispadix]MCH6162392.1 DivIVA domain-containing protein [Streptomyces marispadix]
MFWFLLISLAVVVAAVTLAVVGSSGDGRGGAVSGGLADAPPDQLDEPLPADRPVNRVDVDALRLPVTARGYRMQQVDDVLDRLGAELAERDARIAELESALAGAQAAAIARGEPAGYAPAGTRDLPPSPGSEGELRGRYGKLEEPGDMGETRETGGSPRSVRHGPGAAGAMGAPGPDAPGAFVRDSTEHRDGR